MRCPGCDTEMEPGSEFCAACLAVVSSPTASEAVDIRYGFESPRRRSDVSTYFPSGTLLAGRYRIVRHLGSGGMGVVYQADDLKLDVPVALKFLNRASAGNERRLELFLNEVRLARQITHPNVCRIFDVGEVEGRHFLSMEHVEGEDLASLLRRFGRLPRDKALSIALEICRGLQAAHERGILHGDLKPSNLMIDAHGCAKIMDFGLAKLSRPSPHRSELAGTPDYMAPEQRRGASTSVQTEVYALGLVLYELFTGRRARRDFDVDSDSTNGSSPSDVLQVLDPILERIILHCLERDPGLRPSSVSAIAAALNRLTQTAWRPTEGLVIPYRKHWVLRGKLGRGGFGETWLAEHVKTRDLRVFKFCNDVAKLKAFQREITLFRFMRETLGGRSDIAALLDWQLDEPPYFIESEFAASANLVDWFEKEGGTTKVPRQDRIEVIRRTAVALAAAHSVGVLHKDVKPANVLVGREMDGTVRVRLCDFGVSVLTDEARLLSVGVTAAGMTAAPGAPSPDAGTRLYMAPEVIEGKDPTTAADVYALGVMLYQITVGDFAKALAPGWDRDCDDDLVREDIAASVEGSPDRRVSAAQLAERLRQLPDRTAAREAELKRHEQVRAAEVALRRRRNWATAVLAALLLLSVGLGLAFERAETSARQALIDRTLRSNEAMVRLAAAAVTDKLQDAIRRVEEQATNPTLRELLERLAASRDDRVRAPLREELRRQLDQMLGRSQSLIQSWTVADSAGYLWGRAPDDPAIVGQNYKYREWFNGRVELPSDAAISATPRAATGFSLAFRSTALDRPLMIGVASPIFGAGERIPGGRIVGVLSAGIQLKTFNRWLEIAENLPSDGACPDQFVLLLHRTQLIRHPCSPSAAPMLPVMGFSNEPAVSALLKAAGRRTANFRDPLRSTGSTTSGPALAVAWSLDNLPDWTLILEQDVDVALKPITGLTTDFHGPAHLAFALGAAAFVPLVGLLWWRGRARVPSGGGASTETQKS
jgi:serine/threonine protein kinase